MGREGHPADERAVGQVCQHKQSLSSLAEVADNSLDRHPGHSFASQVAKQMLGSLV